jgi:hypothetical protein
MRYVMFIDRLLCLVFYTPIASNQKITEGLIR